MYNNAFGSKYTALQIDKFKNEDVTAFVYDYPNGCDSYQIMESYIKERISQRQNGYFNDDEYDDEQEYAPPPQQPFYRQPTPPPQRQTYQQPYQQNFQQPSYPAAPSSGGNYGGGYGGNRGFPSFELPDLDWGKIGIVFLVIGIAAGLFGGGSCIGKSSCAGSSANSSLTACVPSKGLDVNFDVGYFSDGAFRETKIVVDDKYYNYLDNAYTTNKFAAELNKGKHTVWVEYYRDGTFYTTNKLEFKVSKKGDLIDLLVYPHGDKLILAFSDT